MQHISSTIAKNASANLLRGGVTAIVALTLPLFLTRTLDHDRFAAWSLLLQIAAWATYFDFSLQLAVARFLAGYKERGDTERRDWLLSTAIALLSLASLLALAGTGIVLWQLPHIFHGIPKELLGELRGAVAILGTSAVVVLPLTTFSGVLVGLHRNEHVAFAVGGSRALGAATVLLAVRYTHSLILLASCIAVANVLGAVVQVAIANRLLPESSISWANVKSRMAADLSRYCFGLTVWTIGMFLINGLDLTIVGSIDFQAVGYYSIAASLITFFSGAHGAVCNALMTPVAALHASGEIDRIQKLILKATRITTFVNVLATILVCLCGRFILQIWVGNVYTRQALPIVEILMVANAMRLVANPYAFVLIATGLQTRAVAQGGVEGVVNLVASLAGAFWLGPIGVALGTLVGAVCGLAWTCLLTVRNTTEISLGRRRFVGEGIVRPFLCSLPLLVYTAVMFQREFTVVSAVFLAICGMLTYLLIDRFGNVLPHHIPLSKAAGAD